MTDEKGIIYNIQGDYLFKGKKGSQEGIIYLNHKNNFVGNILDTGNGYENVPYLIYGYLNSKKLVFLKTPKDPYFSNVFWSLNNKNSDGSPLQYEGYFFLLSSNPGQKIEITNSLEKSIEPFKKNELDKVDSITKKLLEGINDLESHVEHNLKVFSKNGFGNIILKKI